VSWTKGLVSHGQWIFVDGELVVETKVGVPMNEILTNSWDLWMAAAQDSRGWWFEVYSHEGKACPGIHVRV